MAYASRTGTRRNLEALRAAGWGLMVSATGRHRTEGFARYAIDNGAWTAYRQGRAWDERLFMELVEALGAAADFITAPDVVAGGVASLRLTESWLPRLERFGRRLLVPVQDGMQPGDVAPLLGPRVGIFVGGSNEAPTWWKVRTLPAWGRLARERGAHLHVGRVNSSRRIRQCALAGAHSFDGTSPTRYAVTLRPLDNARRQTSWVF
jgi:hypothetical protein